MMRNEFLAWCYLLSFLLIVSKAKGLYVNITYVQSAVSKGAVCLDGSPPAYHLSRGFGSGNNSWLVHIEGGGWCNNSTSCLARRNTRLGSSKQMSGLLAFSGILSNMKAFNPDFYNWNKVKIRYCDGSSFTGDVKSVDPVTNLHYRGSRIWHAVMGDLLAKGMENAEYALLSGCSAGGLASMLHCDSFRDLLPIDAEVKCLSDAGYFINTKDINGTEHIKAYFSDIVTTHESVPNLPSWCTSVVPPELCFFPQYFVQQIQTPLFVLNAAYDSWQIKNILAPDVADPRDAWHNCKLNISQCSPSQVETMQGYRKEFLSALTRIGNSASRGLFINSCYAHCQSEMQELWLSSDSPMLNKVPIAKAVGDWFYDRNMFQKIDCPYPCDSTCRNTVYGEKSES